MMRPRLELPQLKGIPLLVRILSQVQQTESCWLWTGLKNPKGYGVIHLKDDSGKRHTYSVHRLVYMVTLGNIPADLQIDHLCRVRHCVNPLHLEVVTGAENIRRGNTGLHHRRKTHCPHGHEYTAENTYHLRTSVRYPLFRGRVCKICFKASAARSRLKKRLAMKA